MAHLRSVFVVLALVSVSIGTSFPTKQLAGPASEFSAHVLPAPKDGAQIQQSAFLPMWVTSNGKTPGLAEKPQNVLWQSSIFVDSATNFQLAFLSPYASEVALILLDPTGASVDLANAILGSFPVGGELIPESSWEFFNPLVGVYTLIVESIDSRLTRSSVTDDEMPIGYVITLNESPLTMIGHLNTYNMQQGQEVGLIAMLVDNQNYKDKSKGKLDINSVQALQDVVLEAIMAITLPDGTEEDIQMHDDGLHYDQEANDGIYGAFIQAQEIGTYQAQAILQGKDNNGVQFTRSTQHLIASVAADLTLTGSAAGVMTDAEHLTISLSVESNLGVSSDLLNSFFGYAEVWGIGSNGIEIPVCWIGGLTQVLNVDGTDIVNLVLDTKWLSLVQASLPLTLKNIQIQDSQDFIPLSTIASILVSTNEETRNTIAAASTLVVTEITKEMREGVMPESLKKKVGTAGSTGIILLHGYCSSTNPWQPNSADFTNGYYFLKPSASMTHDAFAQAVLAYANTLGLDSYSLIGHSQGGNVATHIRNFYFSGLDLATGGRLIQSVGTPYEGNSAAGSSANLGKLFGIGCGANFDLSLDGARLWEPSVSASTRKDIYYYTTTYQLGNFFGDYCNMAINMLLEWPNDGTAELEYTDIKGANNMGNTQKQCHTTDMSYPPQYNDHTRNKQMNTNAAR